MDGTALEVAAEIDVDTHLVKEALWHLCKQGNVERAGFDGKRYTYRFVRWPVIGRPRKALK